MELPLVSVVCLCYNHERFIEEAVESVINQTYPNIQLVIVDDNSTDRSRTVIESIIQKHQNIECLFLESNLGNCKAFNIGLARVKGQFVVDFATDDVMLPNRIEKQVEFFSTLDKSYGVVFTDAIYVDEDGKFIRNHFEHLFQKRLLKAIPVGDVYKELLSTYFIPSPTMLVRTEVMHALGGYDEKLSYEDFDFWIRSSRQFNYAFLDERLTKIRKSRSSMSVGWYKQGDRQLHSTFLVCKKARLLNKSEAEDVALAQRLKYEIRQSVFSDNRREALLFFDLLNDLGRANFVDRLMINLSRLPLPLSSLRQLYHRWRYS
jgi:glycosyltransferase involved in cell wall biosynthesis